MASKSTSNLAAFGGTHTSGIFSDMTVDGPIIGTLVVIMDRARNLPNKRSMGKQDPYCAARLGKDAQKTKTDKRGGQTPRWDQELRFTVHDSPDYHRLKVSVFNDDRKTELIGETWVSLEAVITPGGGQSDDWHGLNCKGKYAGEIRMELTYYDTRPKAEKPVIEKRKESTRPEGGAVGGPRESTPIKRRPLPSDPTGATPSPVNTPEHRGLKGLRAGPRELGSPRHQQQNAAAQQQSSQADTPTRRPLPDASPLGTPTSHQNTPSRQPQPDAYNTPPNPRSSNPNISLAPKESFDMSYAAPKSYELQTADPVPQHVRDSGHRSMSQDDFRSSRGHLQQPPPEPVHSYSAPSVPTQESYGHDTRADPYAYHENREPSPGSGAFAQDPYSDPSYQVAPLRPRGSHDRSQEQLPAADPYYSNNSTRYIEAPPQHDHASYRRRSAMQPMVEDEDDLPPPPPIHRPGASTLPHPHHEDIPDQFDGAPAPLNLNRYREESYDASHDPSYQQYGSRDYNSQPPSARRMTHPRDSQPQATSRPVSRDAMVPSPLRQETSALPSSLVAGLNPSREDTYQPPPSYETPPRLRHYSEPAEYRAITEYETPVHSQALVHHSSQSVGPPDYYPHDPPEQPRRTSPVHDYAPIVKPRATSPGISPRHSPHPRHSPNPAMERDSRGPTRSMPTRKSVSPRPPPSADSERRLSGVAFGPDSFDVYNPRVSKSPVPGTSDDERPGSSLEMNDKGQIVTFSGRVVDASDHLPIDNWAPEPTPKGTVKEKPIRARQQLTGSRDLEAARQREEKYRQDRAQRDRIRQAASVALDSPNNALVTQRHDFGNSHSPAGSGAYGASDYESPGSMGRNRLQKRNPNQRPFSMYDASPQHSSPSMPEPHVLRERQVPNSYGGSPGYDRNSYTGSRAPPIPAKIPLDTSPERRAPMQSDDMALSLELQSIDIGPGSGGRKPRAQARRQYGF